MNLIYLSPHFPFHYSHFIERLVARKVTVLGISDQPDESLPLNLRSTLSGHYRVDRLDNIDQILIACEFFRQSWGNLDHIESHLETWLPIEAKIRENFDIDGYKTPDLQFIRQKSMMKNVFNCAGVPTARGALVETFDQCKSLIGGCFPAFIKPDVGIGASDTFTVHSLDELAHFFEVKNSYDYFLEEYISGVIESFDGLTDKSGNIVFYASHIFSNDIHKIVTNNENLSYYSLRVIPTDIKEYGFKTVKAANIRGKFFHIEFFRLNDGRLLGLEINVRPPGGLTTHMFNYSSDIDIYDWWAGIVSDGVFSQHYERKYFCAFIARKFDRKYAHSQDDIYSRFGEKIVHSQQMAAIELQVMGNVGYLARATELDELKEVIRFITEEIK